MKYLIKYSPEMTTKSRIVRTRFSKQLRKNLARLLRQRHGLADRAAAPGNPDAIRVEGSWDYLEIELLPQHQALAAAVEDTLRWAPGISRFSRVLTCPLPDFPRILEMTRELYGERLRGRTFAVRSRRTGKHAFSSMDLDRYLGAGLLRDCGARGVNLSAPEVVVALEVRDQELFLVDAGEPGIGGFPLGTQDPVVTLLSGGFDSAVASYLTMKRGMRSHFLFFNLGGREHEIAVKEVALYLWQKFGASHGVHFITVPFEAVVAEILEKVSNPEMGVVLKRMMLRAASQVADELGVQALVTGESVAQVSSQTLTNLAVIDTAASKLVLRPLCMTDKLDIVDLARRIGTEEFSAVIPEYCGVISVKPTTRAKPWRVAREEERFDFTVLEQALAHKEKLDIRKLHLPQRGQEEPIPETRSLAPDAVVIDIRHPDEEELQPLRLAGQEVLKLPFYRLNAGFPQLPPERQYWLYCARGVMSRLHADHLRAQGVDNVGVYRP